MKILDSNSATLSFRSSVDFIIVSQLEQMMRLRHMDLYDVSNLSGIRLPYLKKIFSFKASLSLKTLFRLCDVLDCCPVIIPSPSVEDWSYDTFDVLNDKA